MSDSTTPDAIPYPEEGDKLETLDEHLYNLADRLQALFEDIRGGTVAITPSAADTPTTLRVDFGKTYVLGDAHVVVCFAEPMPSPPSATLWVDPASIDATGFDLGIIAGGTATRDVNWLAVKI